MSWKTAKQDAERWVKTLDIPKPVKGSHINLDDHVSSLPHEGGYRFLVLGAAKKLLEKRGATVRFTTDE